MLIILSHINYNDVRIIIYEIISTLIKDNDKYNKLEEINGILDENFIKKIFKENSELLTEILLRIDYNKVNEKNKVNELIIPFLFNYALKSNQLENVMELLFKMINIKDEYILERLFLIMGFPQIIIEKQKNLGKFEEDVEMTLPDTEQDKRIFFPKFGNSYRKKYHTDEIYKYVSTMKLYESHCILAILFPCKYGYENQNFIKNEQKLFDEKNIDIEKIKYYIYRLLSIALLNEGNYCLFKYLYLTQSRNIIKYKNLYEEMIFILSDEVNNKYNLNEIKKNAEICSKRIEYELGENKELNEPPELPINMRKTFKEYDDVKKFNGFIPKYIPDQVVYAVYTVNSCDDKGMSIILNYYTTFEELEKLREIEKNNDKKDENKTAEEKKEEMINLKIDDNEIDDIIIGKNENTFLLNNYSLIEDNRSYDIQITDESFNDHTNVEPFLLRYIFYNNNNKDILFKDVLIKDENEKYNNDYFIGFGDYFIGFGNIGYVEEKNYGEITSIYRRNSEINNGIVDNFSKIKLNKITFHTESYFNDNDK